MKEKNPYIFKQLTHLLHTGVFCLEGKTLVSYEENYQYNPLHGNGELRKHLMGLADGQKLPVVYPDEHEVYFICIKAKEAYYFIGPMSSHAMNRVECHRFYHSYGIEETWEKGLHSHTVMEILQTASLFANLITQKEYEDQQLVTANQLVKVTKEQETREQVKFRIKEEEEDIYRHTYQEERKILNMVREGNVNEAVRMSKEMDIEVGKLGKDELAHWQNLLVVVATLCARAAIEGGLDPRAAY